MFHSEKEREKCVPLDARKHLSICVLDDDRDLVEITAERLVRAGFQAVATSDPREALDSVRNDRTKLLLFDIQMPLMDGFSFSKRPCEKILQFMWS